MEGFILAAGLGTRLRPLTNDRPKALVEVNGATLLEHTIHRLEEAGINHIVINVHHFAEKVIKRVTELQSDRVAKSSDNTATQPPRHSVTQPLSHSVTLDISDERDLLLDTGGGLKKASTLFSGKENVLVHNVDILSDIDLQEVERQHREQGNLVTLCVSQRETKRMLEFNNNGLLLGRADTFHLSPFTSHLAFSGISVVSPELFALLPEADHPYPVIDEYIRLSQEGHRIGSYVHPADHWLDVGKPETLEIAKRWTLS
jgi:NDP-sugar pyrophosphorylase family protein